MHRAARERGGAADVEPAHGRAVGGERAHGAEEDLVERVAAAADVAADEVGVARLQVGGREHVAGEDALAKARGEALDLGLHALHVAVALGRPVDRVGAVRVGPGGVLARGRARGVGERLLAERA